MNLFKNGKINLLLSYFKINWRTTGSRLFSNLRTHQVGSTRTYCTVYAILLYYKYSLLYEM